MLWRTTYFLKPKSCSGHHSEETGFLDLVGCGEGWCGLRGWHVGLGEERSVCFVRWFFAVLGDGGVDWYDLYFLLVLRAEMEVFLAFEDRRRDELGGECEDGVGW